jgi:hypothetical protein
MGGVKNKHTRLRQPQKQKQTAPKAAELTNSLLENKLQQHKTTSSSHYIN